MPDTMRAWQYTSVKGGMEKNLAINAAVPIPSPKPSQLLVQVHSMALNPVDHKLTETTPLRFFGSVFTPGADFCGRVAKVGGEAAGDFKEGDMVFGAKAGDMAAGTLAQYVVVEKNCLAKLPEGVAVDDAAGVAIVGWTELQSLRPNVKEGDTVFINGGSGGTGVYGVQIAKALGCRVVASCSTANVEFVKSLGADEVVDYKAGDVAKALSGMGQIFKTVVDNIGTPANLYRASSAFIKPGGTFVQVGMSPSLGSLAQVSGNMFRPGFLGGGKAKYQALLAKPVKSDLETLGGWMKEKKIRAVIDSVYEWEDAPKAYEKLKSGRAKGKIVVHVPHDD